MPTALVSRYESKNLSQQRHTAPLNTMPPPMMRCNLKLWLSIQGLHSTFQLPIPVGMGRGLIVILLQFINFFG